MNENINFLSYDELLNLDSKFEILVSLDKMAKDKNLSLFNLYDNFEGLYYEGNKDLLKRPKIAIIGSRNPNQYAKHYTFVLANLINNLGGVVISGGAIGTDIIAHESSLPNTIMVSPSGMNINYPRINHYIIQNIRKKGLLLSEYGENYRPHKYTFLRRNRIIIALSDFVIIPYADFQSGTSSSISLALMLKKNIFTIPHRIDESLATNKLLNDKTALGIYDIKSFSSYLSKHLSSDIKDSHDDDELIIFARKNGSFEEALKRFGFKVYEYELEGKISRVGINIITKL